MGLEDIPALLTSTWGIPLLASQTVCSVVIVLAITLPVLVATRGREPLINGAFAIIGLIVCVAIGWLDAWVLVLIALFIAVGFAALSGKIPTGE